MRPQKKQRPVEHVIGPLEGGVQECFRCGVVLTDYRNVAYPLHQGPPKGMTVGERFVVHQMPNGDQLSISRGAGDVLPHLAQFSKAIAMPCEPLLEHVTGKPDGEKQSCGRCGEVLLDFTERTPDFAPEGVACVATQLRLMKRAHWTGPTRMCGNGGGGG